MALLYIFRCLVFWRGMKELDLVEGWLWWLIVLSAMGVLLAPRSLLLFATMIGAGAVNHFVEAPTQPNHFVFAFFVEVTVGVALIRAALLRLKGSAQSALDRDRIFSDFAPAVRVMLFGIYFWAAFHKYNWGFLDPEYTCGTTIIQAISGRFSFPVPLDAVWFRYACIVGGLALETLIPISLLFNKTVKIGLSVGVLMHFLFATHPLLGITEFSVSMLTLYALFAFDSPDALRWFQGQLDALLSRIGIAHPGVFFRRLRIAICVLTLGWVAIELPRVDHTVGWWGAGPAFRPALFYILVAYYIGLSVCLLTTLLHRGGWETPKVSLGHLRRWSARIFAVLMLIGFSPYLGFRTGPAFSMFSNLEVNQFRWNHLLVPRWVKVGRYDHLVEIVDVENERLERFLTAVGLLNHAAPGEKRYHQLDATDGSSRKLVPRVEALGLASGFWKETKMEYVTIDGVPGTITYTGGRLYDNGKSVAWSRLARKYLSFRKVSPEQKYCKW